MLTSKQIPTTGRKTTYQAKQFGYNSVRELAGALPKNAIVMDIGAGLSRLGHEVAALRDDIRWINVDPCYQEKTASIKFSGSQRASNVEFWSDNIVTGSTKLDGLHGTVDVVYSYWLMPHLSLEADEPAIHAVEHMYDLLKPKGKLIIGPVRKVGIGLLSPFRYKGTAIYTKTQDKAHVATDILNKTKLWWLPRLVQLVSNRHGIHIGAKFVGGK